MKITYNKKQKNLNLSKKNKSTDPKTYVTQILELYTKILKHSP